MLKAEETVHHYLEEGLVALLPHYGERETGTLVFTLQQTHATAHSLSWSVELLARYLCLNLATLRRRSGKILGLRHHIPLPLSDGLDHPGRGKHGLNGLTAADGMGMLQAKGTKKDSIVVRKVYQ